VFTFDITVNSYFFFYMPCLRLVSFAAVNAFLLNPLELHGNVVSILAILTQNKRKTIAYYTQTFTHLLHVFSQHLVTTQPLDFITRLPCQPRWWLFTTCCHLRSSLSSFLGFYMTQKAPKSILKVARIVKIQTFPQLSYEFWTCFM